MSEHDDSTSPIAMTPKMLKLHPKSIQEDSDIVDDLFRVSKKSPKLVRSTIYHAPSLPGVEIRSWRMTEHKYYEIPSPFPTLARGIFTTEVEGESHHRIVARGYDKFFNIGEVPWTDWGSLEAHTKPPYTLTLKSNGCIIFIAALDESHLLVSSKHAIGPVSGIKESHAQAGERWLDKHLKKAGKTREQLASVLYENNWTAIAELCDDDFEEHVLGYSPENTGLHLHGINTCTKKFFTLSAPEVNAFAAEWGFIQTRYTTLKSIADVRAFTTKVAETGAWEGDPIEGFVIRTHVSKVGNSSAPYYPGDTLFFKVKFDEPYLMYRDWREITKILLSANKKGDSLDSVKIPKSKLLREETRAYIPWVKAEIARHPELFEDYLNGKGIIAVRERFLDHQQQKHIDIVPAPHNPNSTKVVDFGKTVIVPIAIPGSGKTATAIALKYLFGFGHTQSDDIKVKRAAPIFIQNVVKLLKTHEVVIADKNNHLVQHRQQLRDAVAGNEPPTRLLAFHWTLDKPKATLHRVCADRIISRGENHQSLRPDAENKEHHEKILWMFLNKTEELSEGEVDAVVDFDIESSLEDMLKVAVDACVKYIGVKMPTQEEMQEALDHAKAYPVIQGAKKQEAETTKSKKTKGPRYYGFLPETRVIGEIKPLLKDESAVQFFDNLEKADRLAFNPHITLVHSKNLPRDQELWDYCQALRELSTPPVFRLEFGHVIWNTRVMALSVDGLAVHAEGQGGKGDEGARLLELLSPDDLKGLHLTVGTAEASINPFEAKALVEEWKNKHKIVSGEGGALKLEGVASTARIHGLFS